MAEKVIIVGVGSMGAMTAKLALKKGMEIVGAFGWKSHIGKDIGEVIGIDKKVGVSVSGKLQEISDINADVALYSTVSRIRDLYPQIMPAIKAGINIISISDEMGFPWMHSEAEDIDRAAKEYKVTVFGTGANPGLLTDVLPVALTSGCHEVTQIKVRRVVDMGPYVGSVLRQFGMGLSRAEWEESRKRGEVMGHMASRGLIRYMADCMNLDLDEVGERMKPVIAGVPRVGLHSRVEKGDVAGIKHIAFGIKEGKEVILFEMNATIQPEAEGVEPGTFWSITGKPSIEVSIKFGEPSEESALVTTARAVNAIPMVINAKSGLLTQKDLPLGTCLMRS